MKSKVNDRTGYSELVMSCDEALMLMHTLHDLPAEQRPNLAGHWLLNLKNNTVTLENLSINQACALDVLMADKLRAANDMVECLDITLEQFIARPPGT